MHDARLPIYLQLSDQFARKIQAAEWGADASIPSELELASQHGVAPGTVRKAIETLVGEGLLVRQQGKGTFVKRANFGNALFRFFRHTDAQGRTLQPSARILTIKSAAPSAMEIERLRLQAREKVIRIRRIRLVASEPLLHEQISLGEKRFKPLLSADWNEFEDLLYPAYETLCQVRIQSASETITFGVATAEIAKNLKMPARVPVAKIERLAFGIDGGPLEWRSSFGLASRFSYSIELR